jgi:hypothetical protein
MVECRRKWSYAISQKLTGGLKEITGDPSGERESLQRIEVGLPEYDIGKVVPVLN